MRVSVTFALIILCLFIGARVIKGERCQSSTGCQKREKQTVIEAGHPDRGSGC